MSDKNPKLCLIDASAYIHRAFHALPLLSTSKGQPVNAVYGFSRMISKVIKSEKPDYLGVCFDTPKPTFRHEQYADYKGTRKEIDNNLISQLPLSYDLALAWGLPCLKLDGYEADDVIATLALKGKKQGWDVLVLSGDKDILQLVENGILVRDEIKKVDYTAEKVFEKYGLTPIQLVDYFCLMGDKVDNVIGVPGVGEKTAAKLIQEYGTLENLYAKLDSVKESLRVKLAQFKDQVFNNRSLIILKSDVPLAMSDNDLKVKAPQPGLEKLLADLEFRGELAGVELSLTTPKLEVNEKRQVHVVLTQEQLQSLKLQLETSTEISFDFETDSLDQHHCGIVGLALSTKENEAFYIPIGHRALGTPMQLIWDNVAAAIRPVFENKNILKIAQNLKFDNAILARHGIHSQGIHFDTMVAAYCLDPNRSTYGLKDLAADYLGERMTHFEELFGGGKRFDISEVAIDQVSTYAGADSEVTLRLAHLFRNRLSENSVAQNLFNNIEMPLVDVIQSMEKAGIRIDVKYLRSVGQKFETEKLKIEKEIFELAGETFVINSPKQLAVVLFEKLKLPPGRKNKTGYSTGEDVLSELVKTHPICEKILSYRELSKLISTYVEGFIDLVDQTTSRVHTSFQQTGTVTGRLSSTSPNLQNIPIRTEQGREIRRAFIASEGNVLVSADYSQIDLRALAHMSGDPALIETFKRGGDIHTATAAEIFHVAPTEVDAEMRRRAKAINFGIVYGQQAWGLSQSLGIEMSEAQDFIKKYFERYAGVRTWIDATLAEAKKTKIVSTWAGRHRRVDDIVSTNASLRGFAERVAMNTPIQGTSADLIKLAMIRVQNRLINEKWKTTMLIQVHDELVFDTPENELEGVSVLIKNEMENAAALKVPLLVDIKVGKNWTEMKKLSMAVAA